MGYIFICKKCGDIKSIDWKVGTRHLTCNKCAEPMDWSNAFPPQSVIDFRNTVDSLFELSKEHDKENLDTHYDFLKNNFDKFDKTQLDKYINQYAKKFVKGILITMILCGKPLMMNLLME